MSGHKPGLWGPRFTLGCVYKLFNGIRGEFFYLWTWLNNILWLARTRRRNWSAATNSMIQNRSDVVAQLLGANKLRSFFMVHKRNVKRKRKKGWWRRSIMCCMSELQSKEKFDFFFSYHISSHKCYRKHRGKK